VEHGILSTVPGTVPRTVMSAVLRSVLSIVVESDFKAESRFESVLDHRADSGMDMAMVTKAVADVGTESDFRTELDSIPSSVVVTDLDTVAGMEPKMEPRMPSSRAFGGTFRRSSNETIRRTVRGTSSHAMSMAVRRTSLRTMSWTIRKTTAGTMAPALVAAVELELCRTSRGAGIVACWLIVPGFGGILVGERSRVKKIALFQFNPDPMCLVTVALNAMEMKDKGYDVKVVVEGDATKLMSLLRNETKPGALEFKKLKALGLIDCVCKACATRNSVVPAIIEQNLKLCDEMSGHPSIARYMDDGYEIVTF